MKIAIIGASAGVGYEAVQQCLSKGDKINALSFNIDTLPDHANLKKIKGSATNPRDVENVIKDTDAVLITIGTKQKKGTTLFSDMARTVVEIAENQEYTGPILVISGFGVGDGYQFLNLFMRFVIKFFLKDQYKDKALMEKIFSQSSLRWEMIQPGILSNANLTENYKIYTSFSNGMKVGKISRTDLAHFMTAEAKNKKYLNKKVVITY